MYHHRIANCAVGNHVAQGPPVGSQVHGAGGPAGQVAPDRLTRGASAAWGIVMPRASATTCEVAAVPRNWQPPPGDAQARQPSSAASIRLISPWA